MKWSDYPEERKEYYRAQSREYKKKNRERIKAQREEYDKQYYKNLSDEQLEKRRVYDRQRRKKISEAKPKVDRTDEFIEAANIKHNHKYDYSKVVYVDQTLTEVTIICPEHGEFQQTPSKHLSTIGCKKCGRGYMDTDKFIKKATSIHNDKYDYSLTNFERSNIKVTILCDLHGEFTQKPNDHLTGYGCPKCGGTSNLSTDEFIEKAKLIHGDKYGYEKTDYTYSRIDVTITCPFHGDFTQRPNNHLSGKGCKKCAVDESTWSYSVWEDKGNRSKHFDSFKVYVIKCWNETESFYKIGKTFRRINLRFKGVFPYKYEVIKIYEGEAKEISLLEQNLKSLNKEHSYLPLCEFNGRHECFSNLILN